MEEERKESIEEQLVGAVRRLNTDLLIHSEETLLCGFDVINTSEAEKRECFPEDKFIKAFSESCKTLNLTEKEQIIQNSTVAAEEQRSIPLIVRLQEHKTKIENEIQKIQAEQAQAMHLVDEKLNMLALARSAGDIPKTTKL